MFLSKILEQTLQIHQNFRENSRRLQGTCTDSKVINHFFWEWSLSKIFFKKFEIFKNKVFTLGIKKFCLIYIAFTNIVSSYLEKHFKSLYEAIWMLRKSTTLPTFICPFAIIRQKGESQNGCFKKTKHAKLSENRTFLTPWYAHIRTFLTPWYADVRVSIRG